eukprot:CAMPEP_0115881160 /NCGR_PEP_ID=MMETSP0287-20121206/28272_1 /TAXON_ID=412157 /ORGANISM="Chrysochromulina rotalis, Strain UIO044" /LENGTH=63 /DNA_ID=CAMNT_0003337051 /DNA_START=203 /DNA_END=394 /DNA_ORIENTATION=-
MKIVSIERMLSKTAHCSSSKGTLGERLGRWGPRAPPAVSAGSAKPRKKSPMRARGKGQGRLPV